AAGGVVFAASASAATAPTVAITAPAQIINDGSLSEPATITINNGAYGSATLVNTRIQIDITGPAGLNCADISLTGAHNFTFTGTGGHCVAQFDGYGQGTGSTPQVFNELVNLDQPGLTGTASTVVSLIQLSGSDPVGTLANSNTANTT